MPSLRQTEPFERILNAFIVHFLIISDNLEKNPRMLVFIHINFIQPRPVAT